MPLEQAVPASRKDWAGVSFGAVRSLDRVSEQEVRYQSPQNQSGCCGPSAGAEAVAVAVFVRVVGAAAVMAEGYFAIVTRIDL